MLFRINCNIPWRDLPERHGPWQSEYASYRRWSRSGLWDRILAALQRELDATGQIQWSLWCIDGSNVRAHKAAAGVEKIGPRTNLAPPTLEYDTRFGARVRGEGVWADLIRQRFEKAAARLGIGPRSGSFKALDTSRFRRPATVPTHANARTAGVDGQLGLF
jgi:hypothetical protein